VIHVFVESNWIVDVCVPTFRRSPEALALLKEAARGQVEIHVPHICFREAKAVILRKHQPKEHSALQQFRKWTKEQQLIDESTSITVNSFLQLFSNTVTTELNQIDQRLLDVQNAPGVDVFALDEQMLERSIALRTEVPDPPLKPFDESILAAVLVRASTLPPGTRRAFCTLDLDLSPIVRGTVRSV
jgi:predicted nucleic acid-binding protein